MGAGLVDTRWLLDNIRRKVGDGRNTSFWLEPWLDDGPLQWSFSRLFELSENKEATVADMIVAGSGVGGEAWQWRRRLYAWEEKLVGECVDRFTNIILQEGVPGRWVRKLHSSQSYSVKSAYSFLTVSEISLSDSLDRFLWLKAVPLKVNIFIWRLFLDRLPTMNNLHKRGVIDDTQLFMAVNYKVVGRRNDLAWFACFPFDTVYSVERWFKGRQISALHIMDFDPLCDLAG
ncbi:hypothetical protein TSUD_136260 [Trifolium subterraneum]|uniref:Reverse transcriptase zinc-binding domain-containing protein n=1 Tax=Trifolium subterraneum TaxID=3900 RepID=A0A2Z6PTZ2_TRISU|nr:hypothetical protein TSUD_136260 [Trifolium subterraneum]